MKVPRTARYQLATAAACGLDGVASTATQPQRWVDKTHEARVIVIGERMVTITITGAARTAG